MMYFFILTLAYVYYAYEIFFYIKVTLYSFSVCKWNHLLNIIFAQFSYLLIKLLIHTWVVQVLSIFLSLCTGFAMTISRGGRPILHMGKYRFYRNNRSKGLKATWFCSHSSSKARPGCRASAITIEDRLIHINSYHNH